jgi:hypothetical protein
MSGMRLKSKFVCVRFDIRMIITEDFCCLRCEQWAVRLWMIRVIRLTDLVDGVNIKRT